MWTIASFTLVMMLACLQVGCETPPKVVRLGGLFDEHAKHGTLSQMVFEFAIHQMNQVQTDIEFVAVSETTVDAFDTSRKACELVSNSSASRIAGLFLLADQSSTDMAGSLAERLGIPVIHPLPELTYLHRKRNSKEIDRSMAMHIHPDLEMLSTALLHFVRGYHWSNIVVLYKGTEGLNRVKSVLNAGFLQFGLHERINMIFWPMVDTEITLKDIRYNFPYRHIIVDIDTEEIAEFLKAALRMGMLTSYHHYMFTSLDLGAVTLDKKYTSGGVNITGYRLLDDQAQRSQKLLSDLTKSDFRFEGKNISVLLEAHHALAVDSVYMYTEALLQYFNANNSLQTSAVDCSESDNIWTPGRTILDNLYNVNYEGLTGRVNITDGKRLDFDLELIEYDNVGNVQVVGIWNISHGLNITKSHQRRREEIQNDLNNKTLRVVVKLEEPFVMEEIIGPNKTRFYGFAIEMLEEIAMNLKLKYEFFKVADETTGRKLANGSWTGMIGTLIKNEADLALGELTINYERSNVIDFTKPYMNMGISILFKRPKPPKPKLFSFLQPFHDGIWVCMIGAYAFVSIYLFTVARFSPYEWKNPHPCNPEFDTLENEFTMLNSFWFTMGSLMLQGSEVAPKASSTRIIAGVWSFFTLILISSYTANLAAFLTITRMSTPIQNADDLSKQTAIKYGCQYGGSTYRFFEKAKIPTYEKMWNFMSQNPDVFVNKSRYGIAKVKGGKYAYLMESTALRYQLTKNCDLMEVGGELDTKGYGIGLPKNSPYREIISKEILRLSESQVLLRLYNNWWNTSNAKCDVRDDSISSTSAAQLGMDNLGGVFVFLVGGFALALLIAILEFFVNAVVNSKTDRQNFCSELAEECKFAINCCGPSKKPTRLLPVKIVKKLMFGYADMQYLQPRDNDNNHS